MVTLKLSNKLFEKIKFKEVEKKQEKIFDMIDKHTGKGNDFLGWTSYASQLDDDLIDHIQKIAQKIRKDFEVLVVIGIGGSYLGSRAVIEALNGLYASDSMEIIFLGNTLSSTYTKQVLDYLRTKKFAVNVISKSGTTTEPAVAFRLVKELLLETVAPEELKKYIFATTDKHVGALKKESDEMGYETFVIPDDVGGRYSVFTPVGLLPIACAGINIKELIAGARKGEKQYSIRSLKDNPAYLYGAYRYLLCKKGYPVELYVTYEPQFQQITEWLKQLFGESEGKEYRGIFPASVTFTTDLHSMGQFIQEGTHLLFETIIKVNTVNEDVEIKEDAKNLDNLNYLKGKKLSYINEKAYEGTLLAHTEEGNIPAMTIEVEKMDATTMGNLLYFFMRSCAFSAYLLDINPFNQPGVEVYKKNMFKLLGKNK